MSGARRIAFLMVALEAGTTAYVLKCPALAAIAVPLAYLGASQRLRLGLAPGPRAVVLAVLAILHWRIAPHWVVPASLLHQGVAYALTECFLALQITLLLTEDGAIPPRAFLLLGTAAMTCTGDSMLEGAPRLAFHAASVAFVCLMAAFCGASQERIEARSAARPAAGRRGAAPVFVATAAAASLASWGVASHQEMLNSAVNNLDSFFNNAPFHEVGFADRAQLGSLGRFQNTDAEATALRVRTPECPGYLRARTYDTLRGSMWSTAPFAASDAPRPVPAGRGAHVSLLAQTGGALLAPMGAGVKAPEEHLEFGVDGTAHAAGGPAPPEYGYVEGSPAALPAPSGEYRKALLGLPPTVDPRVRALAGRILAGKRTVQEKVDAVVAYFAQNYQYHLGMTVPARQDPLTYFLLERPAAHCEYFASGADLLLRLGGVPCRYVTGFVATDYNAMGGFWVARNKDAHAWVEAFDDARGWVTVEATVGGGVPSPPPSGFSRTLARLRDLAGDLLARIRYFLRPGNLRRLFREWFLNAGARGVFRGLLVLAAIAGLAWCARRRRRPRTKVPGESPELAALHRKLRQMDRQVRAAGFVRAPNETLHHFAGRLSAAAGHPEGATLRKAAEWYVEYAGMRYGGN